MDQLLLDAKRLASRLREHNASSDTLIDQANNLHLKLDAMKQVGMENPSTKITSADLNLREKTRTDTEF